MVGGTVDLQDEQMVYTIVNDPRAQLFQCALKPNTNIPEVYAPVVSHVPHGELSSFTAG